MGVDDRGDSDGIEQARIVAERFVAARRAGVALPDYPGTMPADADAGYAIQDAAIRLDGGAIVGWKVGRVPGPHVVAFGADRLVGPIFVTSVRDASADPLPQMPIFADGFGAAEAEYLMRIGATVPAGRGSVTLAEADALIDAVHVGIEVASSPFPGINDHGPAVTISDFGNNYGLVIGAPVPDWRAGAYRDFSVVTEIDGVEVGRATVAEMLDGAVGAVRFLLDHLSARGVAVPEGTWVSTGAVTGVHPVRPGAHVMARFGDALTVECRISAESPPVGQA
jgi:2-keto-4-pentenoate hydratase